ncbi:MAG: tRNA uracil 4-sulfurtransferase ThiI [Bacillota bacterium]
MFKVIIIRYGEMGLKGNNFPDFAEALENDIERRLGGKLDFTLDRTFGRFFLYLEEEQENLGDEVIKTMQLLPGIVSFSPAVKLEPGAELDDIKEAAYALYQEKAGKLPFSFRIETNRADKTFPMKSPDISTEVGSYIYTRVNTGDTELLSVDLEDPDLKIELDIRKSGVYLFAERYSGTGGLPVGSGEGALLLLSGGIDSPVAGWELIRRGIKLSILHFHTPPYTSERSLNKVKDLARKLALYNGPTDLYTANITDIQRQINSKCHDDYTITILRRMMLRIASRLGEEIGEQALITGDSVGQVASQTLASLRTIGDVSTLPVLRPLLSFDKTTIVKIAKEIETFSISNRPYEDCCSLFLPESPITRPRINQTELIESDLKIEDLMETAYESIEKEVITGNDM